MTQKELLYIEDAIGHENTIIKVCEDMINNLQDENLKSFIKEELPIHQNTKENLLNMLEVKSNE
ncbi:MAG: hypothetical protein IKJ43_04280 [Bacilli bacterium]|nr:hypothetical protein [Bacilli bacterium]